MKQFIRRVVLLLALSASASVAMYAQHQVSGKVTDASTGEPVPGAAVIVSQGTGGVVTDANGNYSISVASDATLMCTCIGYVDATQPVNGRGIVNFNLAVDAQLLDETVVVGYGTLKKSQLVGSVEQLAGDVLEDRVNADVTRSLQGQVPGLSIFQSDGKPTHGGQIYIRGGATNYVMKKNMSSKDMTEYSIGQGGSALVLIDGVEGELSSVNPDDIESVTVLKDASSASIYGSRAAYGVILVTTKKSASDKVTISYNGSISLNRRTVM
jgi:TonB-dependent SusC/RagA subfamily outer membrane receptor